MMLGKQALFHCDFNTFWSWFHAHFKQEAAFFCDTASVNLKNNGNHAERQNNQGFLEQIQQLNI